MRISAEVNRIETKKLDRRSIKVAIKYALRPDGAVSYDGSKKWSSRLYNRLTTLAIYGCVDKANVPYTAFVYLKHWSNGWDYDRMAQYFRTENKVVSNNINRALDFIIDNTNHSLLEHIPVYQPQIRPCPRQNQGCKGQIVWDNMEGCYVCFQCSRHFTEELMIIGR